MHGGHAGDDAHSHAGDDAHSHAGDDAHGHAGEPHESPAVMTIPLIILAVASTIGWLINAPFGGLDFLDKWLAPVFPDTIAPAIHVATSTKWIIGLIATAAAFAGLFTGLGLWRRAWDQPALEPAVLRHGWYIDEAVAETVSGPLTAMARSLSFDVDLGLVDGVVIRIGRFFAQSGRQLRRFQTGYVRNYALAIGIGTAIILAYVATRVGS
jgi:NADH-quinone oxidoreductase subunit L